MSGGFSRVAGGWVRVVVVACGVLLTGLVPAGLAAAAQYAPAASAWPGGLVPAGLPEPANAAANLLNSVSCVSASYCVAVGGSGFAAVPGAPPGPVFALAEAWDGRAWRLIPAAVPGLTSVSCVTASWCMAVGSDQVTTGSPVAQVWNGARWRALPTEGGTYLFSVSCVSTSDCVAVGNSSGGDTSETYSIGWNGRKWNVLPLVPGDSLDGDLSMSAVSCVSSVLCIAVGVVTYEWNGHAWSELAQVPNTGDVAGLSCVSAVSCVLSGFSYNVATRATTPVVEAWNGSSWQVMATPSPQDGTLSFAVLAGASCSAVSACMTVGYAYMYQPSPGAISGSYRTLAEQWDGHAWQIRRTPSPGDQANGLSGISCRSATACMAAGSYLSGSDVQEPLAESWNGRSWRARAVPGPGAHLNELAAVSCPGASFCVGVGGYDNDLDAWRSLAESWNGRTWQPLATQDPGAVNDFTAVACTSASACIAVGSYLTRASVNAPYGPVHIGCPAERSPHRSGVWHERGYASWPGLAAMGACHLRRL